MAKTLGLHIGDTPEDAELEKYIKTQVKQRFSKKTSAFLRHAVEVERDLSGSIHAPTSPNIIEELCRVLRPDKVSEISIHLPRTNQPALLARLLEAMPAYLPRDKGTHPIYLLTGREAAALAISAAARQDHDTVALMMAVAPDLVEMIGHGNALGSSSAKPAAALVPQNPGILAGKQGSEHKARTRVDTTERKTGT